MLLALDLNGQTVRHYCGECHAVRLVPFAQVQVTAENLIIGPCPTCQADGLMSQTNYRRDLTRADTGEIQHPQSMVGTILPSTGGVVVEDSRFESPHHRKQQALLIRELMAALNLPLAPDPQAKHP